MRVDRISIAILSWIRRVFARPEQRSHSFQPTILKRKTTIDRKPIRGALALVERRTKRAVRTWIYMPPRKGLKHSEQFDIHICLDTLERMQGERNEPEAPEFKVERSKGNTHRITVLKASHWCSPSGAFDSTEIFSSYASFSGPGQDPNRWAIAALDDLAFEVPFRWSEDGRWDWSIEVKMSHRLTKG